MTVSSVAVSKEQDVTNSEKTSRHQWEKIKKPPTFCVVLPVCDAQEKIAKRVTAIVKVLDNIRARTTIIVVNDGSRDQTSLVLQQLTQVYPQLVTINRPERKGYGSATRAGFRAAIDHGFDYALVLDGEAPANAESIEDFLRPMLLSYDFIKASRYSPYSKVRGVSMVRRFTSVIFNKVARRIVDLPITDYSNGVRAIKCTLLARMMTEECGPALLIEEIVQGKRLGAKFFEVPHTLTPMGSESLYSASPSTSDYGKYLKHLLG